MDKSAKRRIGRSLGVAILLSLLLVAVAQAQTVNVIFPNLADGQTIGGKINLSVTVNAPQPIASVEYRLNNQSLSKITLAPFNYEWDTSATAPGAYILSAIVIDQGGHTGQAQVTLTIAKPVQIAISAAPDAIRVGDKVALTAEVSALIAVARVDLLIDGQTVSSDTTPPFAFTFDSAAYSVGSHLVTLRAEDILGRQGEASRPLQFNAADQTGWLRGLIGVAVIATVIAAILVVWRTLKMTRRSYLRAARIDLHNLGNVACRYELRAEEATGLLKFQLFLNDVALPATGGVAPAPPELSAVGDKETGKHGTVRKGPGSAIPTTDGVKQSGGALADRLMSIGNFLPRSIGGPLINAGSNLRQAQYTASRAQNVADRLPLTPAGAANNAPPVPPAPTPHAAQAGALPVWQTPYLEPDDALTLKLVIDPGRPRQTQQFAFRLASQPIDHAEAEVQIVESVLNIAGLSLLRMYLPFFIVAGVTLAIFLIIALLLANSGALN